MKKMALGMCLILLILSLCGFNSNDQKVFDEAGLLTQTQIDDLQSEIVKTAEYLKMDVIIVTIDDAGGKTAMEAADDFYDEHAFGYEREHGSGILFLIDMDNRETYISTAGEAMIQFRDEEYELIFDDIAYDMKQGNYYNACSIFLKKAYEYGSNNDVVEGYYDEATDSIKPPTKLQQLFKPVDIAISLAGSLVIAIVIVAIMAHGNKARMSVGRDAYLKDNRYKLNLKSDNFTHQTVTTRHIPRNDNHFGGGGGGGGGGSSHTSSGGHSHSGGGRGF